MGFKRRVVFSNTILSIEFLNDFVYYNKLLVLFPHPCKGGKENFFVMDVILLLCMRIVGVWLPWKIDGFVLYSCGIQ